MNYSNTNNWLAHPELSIPLAWVKAKDYDHHIIYESDHAGSHWAIRINDFPDEPLYTVVINEIDVFHFDEWPQFWLKPNDQ